MVSSGNGAFNITPANGRRIIAIAGKAVTTSEMINYEPEDVEIWGLSDSYLHLRRPAKLWFEIHTPDPDGLYRGYAAWREGGPERYLAWLWDCGIPVYMNKVDPQVPTSVAFPFAAIGAKYRPYWTSTIAYMLSLAAYERVDEVHLWGVEMIGGTEYEYQRPCAEYWLGVLETQGCRIFIPDCSPILKPVGGNYGVTTRRFLAVADIQDEISQWDTRVARGDMGALRGREALLNLQAKLDPTVRTRVVEPEVFIEGDTDEALEKRKQEIREAVLGAVALCDR